MRYVNLPFADIEFNIKVADKAHVLAVPSALVERCSIRATGVPSRTQAGFTGQDTQLLFSSRPRMLGVIAVGDGVDMELP